VALDLRLHDQIIETVVAAHENEEIDLGGLDLRDRVVDAGMRDLVAPGRKAITQLGGVRRVDKLNREPAFGVEALRKRGELREVRHPGEDDDLERRLRRGSSGHSSHGGCGRTDNGLTSGATDHNVLPINGLSGAV